MQTQISRRKQLLGFGTALIATACVSTRLDPGTDHPANARAETAPPAAAENVLASSPPQPTSAPTAAHEQDHAAPLADTYTCPMHPQIVSSAPGKCPICGMNLVKKQSASHEGAAH